MGLFAVNPLGDSARPGVAKPFSLAWAATGRRSACQPCANHLTRAAMSDAHRSTRLIRPAFPPIVGSLVPQFRGPTCAVSALEGQMAAEALTTHQPGPPNPLTRNRMSGVLTIPTQNIGTVRPPDPGRRLKCTPIIDLLQ
jgi:hypothetical protein